MKMGLILGGGVFQQPAVSIVITPDGGAKAGGDGFGIGIGITITPDGGVKVGGDSTGPWQATVDGISFWFGTDRHRGKVRLRDILFALRREIIYAGVFNAHQVYIRLDLLGQNENPASMDDYLEIVLLNELSDQNTLSGGGREADMRAEPIELRIFHRLGTDQRKRHTHWTIDQKRSASRKADELIGVVQLLDVVDESGTALLSEPMRVKGPTSFQVDRRNWGYAAVRVELIYTAELDLVP